MILVHGSNLRQKQQHKTKYTDAKSRKYLKQIRIKYDQWNEANLKLIGPTCTESENDKKIVARRVQLFEYYKTFLDQQHYAEQFDSRSNLHSTVIEEFMCYLFKDALADFGEHALIGKSHTFKDIFFDPPGYAEMLKRPYGKIERKDHDFVIGATVTATFLSATPPAEDPDAGAEKTILTEEPADHDEVRIVGNAETHLFDIPAVAIECKTYLDKTMLEGSSRAAEEIQARNPNALYVVVAEWLKLTGNINLRKYKVDQIYVLRKQRNTDREFRYDESYTKNPIDPEAVWHLFTTVRKHLTTDWLSGVDHGLNRGWLI